MSLNNPDLIGTALVVLLVFILFFAVVGYLENNWYKDLD